jgi:hypothetical protein
MHGGTPAAKASLEVPVVAASVASSSTATPAARKK